MNKKKLEKKIVKRIDDLDLPEKGKLRAVALKYDVKKDRAPRIIAQGRGSIAGDIMKLAEEHGIPFCEDPALAELLSKLELNQDIPGELYTLVAEVLAFVFQLERMAAKRKQLRRKFAKK